MVAGIEVVVLQPGTYTDALTNLSQELAAADLAPWCSVGWAELECFHQHLLCTPPQHQSA